MPNCYTFVQTNIPTKKMADQLTDATRKELLASKSFKTINGIKTLMDTFLLDPVVGLFPSVGDLLTGVLALPSLYFAFFKVKSVRLLGNVTDDFVAGFRICLNTPVLTQEFRHALVDILKSHKGNVPLYLQLYDPQTRYRINMSSRKYKITVDSDLIDGVDSLGLQWEVVKK